jgi:hypothetical protein
LVGGLTGTKFDLRLAVLLQSCSTAWLCHGELAGWLAVCLATWWAVWPRGSLVDGLMAGWLIDSWAVRLADWFGCVCFVLFSWLATWRFG